MTTQNPWRLLATLSEVVVAACLLLTPPLAWAQNPAGDAPDKSATRGISSTTGPSYAGGDSYSRTAPTRWADALYDDILPNKPELIPVANGRGKKPHDFVKLLPTPAAVFRLTSPGETVLRLSLSALAHADKLDDPTLAVDARVDGGPVTNMTFKAKKFKSVIAGTDSTCWMSEAQDLYLPLAEGAHVVEIVDAQRNAAVTVLGTFAVPSGTPPR